MGRNSKICQRADHGEGLLHELTWPCSWGGGSAGRILRYDLAGGSVPLRAPGTNAVCSRWISCTVTAAFRISGKISSADR